jgi:hypothetical protein
MTIQSQAAIDEAAAPKVFNKVDDPNVPSVTSVGVYEEKADDLPEGEVSGKEVEGEGKVEGGGEAKPSEPLPVKAEEKAKSEEVLAAEKADADKKAKEKADADAALADKQKLDKKKADDDRRFAAITKARRTAEHSLELANAKIKELQDKLSITEKNIPIPNKPKLEDFDDESDFHVALAEWVVDKKQHELQAKEVEKEVVTAEQQAFTEIDEELDIAMNRGREKYDDFNDKVLGDPNLYITPAMVESALLSDIAEDIFYYLGTHGEEAAKIAGMHPLRVAREITSIEKEILKNAPPLSVASDGTEAGKDVNKEATSSPNPPITDRKVSGAPEPITPLRSEGIVDKDPSKMTAREYRAWRERQR